MVISLIFGNGKMKKSPLFLYKILGTQNSTCIVVLRGFPKRYGKGGLFLALPKEEFKRVISRF